MATLEAIMAGAREHLRDFPRFFAAAVAKAGVTLTFKTGHLNMRSYGFAIGGTNGTASATGVHVGNDAASSTVFTFVLDEAEGLVRIIDPITGGFTSAWNFNIEGYYYEWISDKSMRYLANKIVAEHAYHRFGFDLAAIGDVEEDVIALGAAVECCFALLVEYSRDIDINLPDGIPVQASTRFRQVQALLLGDGGLGERYAEKANMLGVGLNRIEVITLRRVSYQTNRLVPVYTPREYDDAHLPQRQFAAVDRASPTSPPPGFVRSPTVQGFYDGSGGGVVVPDP